MEKQNMIQVRFGRVKEYSWLDIELLQTDAGTQFTPNEYQKDLSVHGVRLAFMAPDH